MANLSENHKRRILVTFQRAEEMLIQSLHALSPPRPHTRSLYLQDIPPSQLPRIENQIKMIRDRMRNSLERLQIELPERSTPSSWAIRTNLTTLDIALEDLSPKKLKGYGEMDSAAASELAQSLHEIRKLVNQLLKTIE